MAQEVNPWEEFQPSQQAGQGIVIPAPPEKPREVSGYEPDPNKPGFLRPIPGGPADKPAKPLPETSAQKLTDDINQVDALSRALNSFQDDYAGSVFTSVENLLQGLTSEFGTPGQRNWWADFKASDNVIRNTLFGASLTPGEKASYEQTTITPSMDPKTIRENLQKRLEVVRSAAQRRFNRLNAAGYNPDEINAIVGEVPIFGEPETPEGPPAEGTEAPALEVARGERISTEQDIANAQRLQSAWAGGASVEEINRLSIEITGQPLAEDDLAALREDVNTRSIRFTPATSGFREGAEPGVGAAIGTGLIRGATAALGEEALAAAGLPTAAAELEAAGRFAQQEYPISSTAAEIVSGALSPLARLAPGGTVAGEALRGAIYGGLYGAGEAPMGAPLEQRLTGAALGGTVGGVTGGLAQRLLGGAPAAAAAPGTPPAPPTTGLMRELAEPATPSEIITAGERANIPVMTSDIRPPETFIGGQAQRLGERIPIVGTGGARATQQTARENAVRDFILENAGAIPEDVQERMVNDVIRKRGDIVTKYTTLKSEVFSNLAGAGDVPVNRTLQAIDDRIAELAKAQTPAADEAIAKLRQIRQQAEGRNIESMEAFRRDVLGPAWQDETLSVGASDRVKSAVQSLYGPFKEDMGQFILDKAGKRDYTKWRVADARLADNINEAKRSTLKNILRRGEATPEIIDNMLFSGKKSDVSALYRSLTPDGQAQARMAIVNRIAKDIGADQAISPEKFLSQLRKRSDQIGVFFNKAQQEEIKGLARALQATRRAGGAGVTTPTGQENWLLLASGLGLDVLGTGGVGTALGATFAAAVRAYESKPVRNTLAALAKTKSGSNAESNLLSRLNEQIGKFLPTPGEIGRVAAGQTAASQVAPPNMEAPTVARPQ